MRIGIRIGIDNIFYHTIPPSATESGTFAFSFFCRLDLSVRNRYAESKNKRRAVSACSGTPSPCRRARTPILPLRSRTIRSRRGSKRAARHISGGAPSFTTATSGFLKRTEGSSSGSSARDSRGTVYLFAVNRAHAEDDRMIPPDKAAELVCYGRLELKKPVPLPMD